MSSQVGQAVAQAAKASKQCEIIEKDKKQLFDKCFNAEQALSDKERDCELKAIKIESLESILQKREPQFLSSAKKIRKESHGSQKLVGLEEKVQRLEFEKEQLIKQIDQMSK